MTVFKSFFTVFKKHIGMFIMYTCIFLGIVTAITRANGKNDMQTFKSTKLNAAYFNHSDGALSEKLIEYLKTIHNMSSDYKEDIDTYRDEIYNRTIDYVLIIPENFEETHKVEAYKLPGSVTASFMDLSINNFIRIFSSYKAVGLDDDAAYNSTLETMNLNTEIIFADKEKNIEYGDEHYFYVYMPYVLISVICLSLSPVLIAFNRDEIRHRTLCSGISIGKRNTALTAGCLILTCGISVFYAVVSIIMYKGKIFNSAGALRLINMFTYAFVALSLSILLSSITKNQNVISMFVNAFGLGSSFICGIFVPREFLGDGVLKAGRIFPAYWYVNVEEAASNLTASSAKTIISGLLIQILYTLVILAAALIINNKKKA